MTKSDCTVAREWFRAIYFHSSLRTVHAVPCNTFVDPFGTELSWSRHLGYIKRSFRESETGRKRVQGEKHIQEVMVWCADTKVHEVLLFEEIKAFGTKRSPCIAGTKARTKLELVCKVFNVPVEDVSESVEEVSFAPASLYCDACF